MPSKRKTIKKPFEAEQSDSEQRELPPGVVRQEVKNIQEKLLKTDLFRDCKDCLKSIKDDGIFIVDYDLGDKIITHVNNKGQHLPAEEQFRLGSKAQGEAAKDILNLNSNPLFVVLRGNVEVHCTEELGLDDQLETIPILTLSSGETFGDYEFGLRDKVWTDYMADATAGWCTVHLNAPFTNDNVWQVLYRLTGVCKPQYRDRWQCNNSLMLKRILHQSFAKLHCNAITQIAVIPQKVMAKMKNYWQVLDNFNNIMNSHLRRTMPIHPLQGGSYFTKDKITEYFVKSVIPKLMNGDLPVLVPCTEFSELHDWWRKIHLSITAEKGIQLQSLALPYLFFVPSSGKQAVEKCKCAIEKGYPAWGLSRAMIRTITRNYALSVGGKQKTLCDDDFIKKVNKSLSPTYQLTFGNLNIPEESRFEMLKDALSLNEKITEERIQKYLHSKPHIAYKHGIMFYFRPKTKKGSCTTRKGSLCL